MSHSGVNKVWIAPESRPVLGTNMVSLWPMCCTLNALSREGFGNIPLGGDIISELLPCEPSDLLQSILEDLITPK